MAGTGGAPSSSVVTTSTVSPTLGSVSPTATSPPILPTPAVSGASGLTSFGALFAGIAVSLIAAAAVYSFLRSG